MLDFDHCYYNNISIKNVFKSIDRFLSLRHFLSHRGITVKNPKLLRKLRAIKVVRSINTIELYSDHNIIIVNPT